MLWGKINSPKCFYSDVTVNVTTANTAIAIAKIPAAVYSLFFITPPQSKADSLPQSPDCRR